MTQNVQRSRTQQNPFLKFQGHCTIFDSESYLAAFGMSENMHLDTNVVKISEPQKS